MIETTVEYSKFRSFFSNRDISEKHVCNLMEDETFPHGFKSSPIIVNKEYYVIDGQHRLEAARRLKIPIYYVVDERVTEIDIVNRNTNLKPWKGRDYINFYSDKVKSYFIIKDLLSKYKCTLTQVIGAVCGLRNEKSVGVFVQMKKGKIQIEDIESELYLFFQEWHPKAKQCQEIRGKTVTPYFTECYVRAFATIFTLDFKKFKKIMEKITACSFPVPYFYDHGESLNFLEKVSKWMPSKHGFSE